MEQAGLSLGIWERGADGPSHQKQLWHTGTTLSKTSHVSTAGDKTSATPGGPTLARELRDLVQCVWGVGSSPRAARRPRPGTLYPWLMPLMNC